MSFWINPTEIPFGLHPGLVEEVTPEEYVRIYEKEPDHIESVVVVPCGFGDQKFGRILLIRKRSSYKPLGNLSPYDCA